MVSRLFRVLLLIWCVKGGHMIALNRTEGINKGSEEMDTTVVKISEELSTTNLEGSGRSRLEDSEGLVTTEFLQNRRESSEEVRNETDIKEVLWKHLNHTHRIYSFEPSKEVVQTCFMFSTECPKNMRCSNKVCVCGGDNVYFKYQDKCLRLKADYGDTCVSSFSTCYRSNMVCSMILQKCACASRYYYNGISCYLKEPFVGDKGFSKRQEIITAALIAVGCIAVAIVCILFLCVTKRINQIRGLRQARDMNDLFRPSEEFSGVDKPPTYDQFLETERAVFGVPPPDYEAINAPGPSLTRQGPAVLQSERAQGPSCPQLEEVQPPQYYHPSFNNPSSLPSTSEQASSVEMHLPSQWQPISATDGSVQDGYVRYNTEDAPSLEGGMSYQQWVPSTSTSSLVDKKDQQPQRGITNTVFSE